MSSIPLPDLAPIMPWGPVVDGTDTGLRDLPIVLLDKGDVNSSFVPTIIGTNKDEGNLFVPAIPLIKGLEGKVHFPLNDTDVLNIAKHFFPSNYSQVISAYF